VNAPTCADVRAAMAVVVSDVSAVVERPAIWVVVRDVVIDDID
jgi:hypothetical protein